MKYRMEIVVEIDDYEVERYMRNLPWATTAEEAIELEIGMHLANCEELMISDVQVSGCEEIDEIEE